MGIALLFIFQCVQDLVMCFFQINNSKHSDLLNCNSIYGQFEFERVQFVFITPCIGGIYLAGAGNMLSLERLLTIVKNTAFSLYSRATLHATYSKIFSVFCSTNGGN